MIKTTPKIQGKLKSTGQDTDQKSIRNDQEQLNNEKNYQSITRKRVLSFPINDSFQR